MKPYRVHRALLPEPSAQAPESPSPSLTSQLTSWTLSIESSHTPTLQSRAGNSFKDSWELAIEKENWGDSLYKAYPLGAHPLWECVSYVGDVGYP